MLWIFCSYVLYNCVVKCELSLGSREPQSSHACVLWTPENTSRLTCYLAFRDTLSQLWVVIKIIALLRDHTWAIQFKFCEISNQALLKFLSVCVQVDLLLLNSCSVDDKSASGHLGGFLQLIKFSKTSKLIKIARIVRIFRLAKVFKLLKKIEDRFVMVRLTAFKAMSILGGTFIMVGCMLR